MKGPRGLVEEVYRVGGRYDPQIRAIVEHLEAAKASATPAMARALDALVKWYRTGEATDRRAYDVAWVEDKASPVDTINGFTEVYLDARGAKGSWEALVFYVNREKTAAIQRLAAEAQWFEDRMPWDPKYRKPNVTGITANAIDVVIETGDAGPVTPIGINLPNDEEVREKNGSKSVSLSNVSEAYDKSASPGLRNEFSWTPEESARAEKWGGLGGEITTNMHEAIGHASGRLSDRVNGKSAGVHQGALLRAGGGARRSHWAVLHRRSENRGARPDARSRPGGHRPRRVRGLHAQCARPTAASARGHGNRAVAHAQRGR